MKKLFSLLLAICMVFAFNSCGKQPVNKSNKDTAKKKSIVTSEKASANTTSVKKSKTYENFLKIVSGDTFLVTMKIGDQDTASTLTSAKKDGKLYNDVLSPKGNFTTITKENKNYILLKDKKTFTVSAATADGSSAPDMSKKDMFDTKAYDTLNFTTGKTEIDGKSYDYEEYFKSGITLRYCFIGDQLKYMIMTSSDGKVSKVEFLKVTNDVPDTLFDVPSDYQETTT